MTESDRAKVLSGLEATRDAFRNATSGLSDAQSRFKPSPDRWNIEEIVEHVAVAEHGMYRFITGLHKISDDTHEAESAASLARLADRKARPFQAPERVVPKGKYPSLSAALNQFLENRARTIEFVKTCQDELRFRIIDHPAGLMNGFDCLQVVINHPARHVEQINELKADPAYPR